MTGRQLVVSFTTYDDEGWIRVMIRYFVYNCTLSIMAYSVKISSFFFNPPQFIRQRHKKWRPIAMTWHPKIADWVIFLSKYAKFLQKTQAKKRLMQAPIFFYTVWHNASRFCSKPQSAKLPSEDNGLIRSIIRQPQLL